MEAGGGGSSIVGVELVVVVVVVGGGCAVFIVVVGVCLVWICVPDSPEVCFALALCSMLGPFLGLNTTTRQAKLFEKRCNPASKRAGFLQRHHATSGTSQDKYVTWAVGIHFGIRSAFGKSGWVSLASYHRFGIWHCHKLPDNSCLHVLCLQ